MLARIASAVRLLERVAPKATLHIRGRKNRRDLFGLHAPAQRLVELVPSGRPALDVGANRGLYAYWMGTTASKVELFEPNPHHARLLRRSAQHHWSVHEVALSDRSGTAQLHVPDALDGEAGLLAGRAPVGDGELYLVERRTIDSFSFDDIGFLKIDVEGHELAVLAGAERSIRAHRPTIFVELEERHRPGAVEEGSRALLDDFGYAAAYFFRRGQLMPIEAFDSERDQVCWQHVPSSANYVSNFVFLPD